MGRTKNSPKKNGLALGNGSLSMIGEFVPFFRGKKKKKQCLKTRTFPLYLVKDEAKDNFLGTLRVGTTSNVLPENMHGCKLTFKQLEDDEESIDFVLEFNNVSVVVHSLDDVYFLKDFLETKTFSFDIFTQNENVYFKMYLVSIPLPKFHSKVGKCIKTAFTMFYNIESKTETNNDKSKSQSTLSNKELKELYEKLVDERVNFDISLNKDMHISQLKPKLRPYQAKAVKWMIRRETVADDLSGGIHPLYQKIILKSGKEVYLDKYTGWLEETPPVIQGSWKGGILADEMGLGKTVEVLALILSHRMTQESKLKVNGCRIESDSDSEDELVIRTPSKKRKLIQEDQAVYVPPKKNKIPDSLVKGSTKMKSATFQALQSIYNRTLSEYCTTEARQETEVCRIQCICGSDVEDGSVECQNCGKWQHSACLGWRSRLGEYKCPQCWESAQLLNSGATLIVAPAALRRQWCREMKTHLKYGLKVLNYEGYSATPVYPTELMEYDIVITTYNVLQAEMRLTEVGQTFNLRKQRKYWPGGSPLVRVRWWRLCLDEAQTVETPKSIVSLMARKIPACNRWAVTGTPLAKGVADIYGLIDYLQMEPYCDHDTWKNILYDPYLKGNKDAMYSFLSKVLWRTAKESVLDQINIPKQRHEMHLLEFSAVEKFFYTREHEVCARDFLQIAAKFDNNLSLEKMDRSDLKNLMAPLLSLRQACSDPSAVRGKGRYLSLKKNASSMKDLLEALVLKNRNDCEESIRLMVSSINGLAGIFLLMNDSEQATREYRKVLQLAARFSKEEKNGHLTIDKLPLIHAMHNLAEVLDIHQPSEHTLRDGSLRQDCVELEKQYIEKFMKETAVAQESCSALMSSVAKFEEDFILKHGQWYSDGMDWVAVNNWDTELIARIEVAAANANVDCDLRAESARTLLRSTYQWHEAVENLRAILFDAIDALYEKDPETKHVIIEEGIVEEAMDCHLRPQQQNKKKKGKKCPVCVANVKLKDYEVKLFTMKRRADMFEDMGLMGSWKPRIEELILKALLGLLKSRNSNLDLIKDGETHVLLVESLKKEFKEIRKVWTLLDRQVCAQDELGICKVRLQLKTDDENKNKASRILKNLSYEQALTHENINLIKVEELPHQELSLRSEETNHGSRLESLLGTRNYLETLRQQQFEGYAPDACPICRGPLVNTWAILSCAHTFCLGCFKQLINKASTFIQCSVCRSKQNLQEVAYIGSGPGMAPQANSEEIQVHGNFSRKVEDVVRLLLRLRMKEPQVKVLVFSTWPIVLKLLKKALEQNDIKVEVAGNGCFEKKIESFKDPLMKITVLLLPIRLGAKGLNLIEATHVILLEPLLNPADELQAIGRVHRIGQTKPTVVHKFLVRRTVEESLHEATSTNAAHWEHGKITVGQLKGLFKGTIENEESEMELEEENSDTLNGDMVGNDETEVLEERTMEREVEGVYGEVCLNQFENSNIVVNNVLELSDRE